MTDWFRSWHGAPTDPKWLGIAKRAGVPPGVAVAVAWALMDRASQAEQRGSIKGYDADGLAYFFGCEPEQVDAIVAAMVVKGIIVDDQFAAWEKRQPKREDDSSQRVREFRKRQQEQDERPVTPRNAPETDTEVEEDTERKISLEPEREFDDWYAAFPRHVGKGQARKAYRAARKKADAATLLQGALSAAKQFAGTEPQFVPHPNTWLNGERWLDQTAATKPRKSWRDDPEMRNVL